MTQNKRGLAENIHYALPRFTKGALSSGSKTEASLKKMTNRNKYKRTFFAYTA